MEFIYCCRLNSQYSGPLKAGTQDAGRPRGCGDCGGSYATVYATVRRLLFFFIFANMLF